MSTYLVVADRNSWSMGLARSLHDIGVRDDGAAFVVIVPADVSPFDDEAEALRTAREAAARASTSLRLQGLTVLDAVAGPASPRKALEEEMDRHARSYDGIVVGASRKNPLEQVQPEQASRLERELGIPVRLISLTSAVMTH
jgi:hypothetical protein